MFGREKQYRRSPFAGVLGMLFVLLLVYIIFRMIFGAISLVWGILAFAAPILLIVSMFLNFNVVKDYVTMLFNTIKKDTVRGLLYTLGSIIGYPLVSAFLFYKAITTRQKIKKQEKIAKNKKANEDYVEFEEIQEEDFLILEDIDEIEEVQKPKQEPLNRYDDLF